MEREGYACRIRYRSVSIRIPGLDITLFLLQRFSLEYEEL